MFFLLIKITPRMQLLLFDRIEWKLEMIIFY